MSNLDDHQKNEINENKEQIPISENATLDYSARKTDITPKRVYLSKHFPFEKGRRRDICFGIIGILLIVIANLIILGNNVLIKEFGIDYVDMIMIRSTIQLIILGIVIKLKGKDLWINYVDDNKSITKIRLLSFLQGIFSGFAIIGGYLFLFYMPLGLALAIIYACPIVGIVLPRIFPRKKFGKYLSLILSAILLISCFLFLPLVLFYINPSQCTDSQSNSTVSAFKNTTHQKSTFDNVTGNNYLACDELKGFVGIDMYYLGVGMALLISISDAAHKIIVGYLYGNKSTKSTLLTTYYAGYGGIFVGLIASIFDGNQRILSLKIINVPSLYWGILFGLAFLKLVTFIMINAAVKLIRPLILALVKYRRTMT